MARCPQCNQPGDKKKKKIAPQLIGPVGSAAPSGAFAAGSGGTEAGGAGPKKKGGGGGGGSKAAAGKQKGSSSGYLRLKRAAEDDGASVKQLRAATKAHNERYCIKVGVAPKQSCAAGSIAWPGDSTPSAVVAGVLVVAVAVAAAVAAERQGRGRPRKP